MESPSIIIPYMHDLEYALKDVGELIKNENIDPMYWKPLGCENVLYHYLLTRDLFLNPPNGLVVCYRLKNLCDIKEKL